MTNQCARCGGHGWVIVGYGETAGADACPVCIEGPEEMKLSFQPPEEDDPRDDDQRHQCESPDYERFLSDVHTAAGLLEHGKRDKGLAARLGDAVLRLMPSATRTRGYLGSTPDGGIDDHDEPTLPESLTREVDVWFAQHTGLGGCSDKDVADLAAIFYGVTHEGGRESVDDALAVVDSFGPGIEGLNDTYARQVLLAQEVRRLHADYIKAVQGRQEWRDAAIRARLGGKVEADLRAALRRAVDHIDMAALRISHCKDAAPIEATLPTSQEPKT